MASAHPDTAAIDAALAKGKWWTRLFDHLADRGMRRAEALAVQSPKGLWRVVDDFERVARAIRLAIVVAMRVDGFLNGLAELRRLSPDDLAAARARARAKAEAEATARETAREKARARREARAAEVRERAVEIIEREKPACRDRDPLVEALDKRLAVDPALVHIDDLPLRETVMHICADLGITPDWSRWEAGDWTTSDPPVQPAPKPKPAPPQPHLAQKSIPVLWRPAPPRRTVTAISLALATGPNAPPWRPPRPG